MTTMLQQPTQKRSCGRAAGFTLAELLVVIGIIAVLLAIVLPVVNRVKKQGWRADSLNQISVLTSAIEQYYLTFNVYPGPFSNAQIASAGQAVVPGVTDGPNVTMSENLALGLLGGLELVPGTSNARFSITAFGKGPASLNSRNPKIYNAFIDNGLTQTTYRVEGAATGKFKELPTGATPADDTNVPEFLDRFPHDPLPVLYLRAQAGETGNQQYRVFQTAPYTKPANGAFIGPTPTIAGKRLEHGLTVQGGPGTPMKPYPLNATENKGNELIPYLMNRQVPVSGGEITPRGKDKFVLIGAGADRVYGTDDDLTSFGSVSN